MMGSHHFTRVDTQELKDSIFRKIGHQRAEKYFDQLKRFFCLKLSKADFDKSCIRTIGRENISLHNKLIRSILQNACHAKIPPQKPKKAEGLSIKVANGYQRNCLQSLYGDSFPQSPRKCRSPRKFRDRPSPLGPLGKSPSLTCEETVTRTQEQQSATELQSLCSMPPVVEDGEEVEQFGEDHSFWNSSPITAPFGVSFNKRRDCGYNRYNKYNSVDETCQSSGVLPDSRTLRARLEKKLALDGIGVSMECANLLNNALDVYLKRLIEPCIGISGSVQVQSNNRMTAGVLPGRSVQRLTRSISMQDFRVAMESNPRVLGQDWPVQLEKICNYAVDE